MSQFESKRRFPRIPSDNAVLVKRLGQEEAEGFTRTRVVGLGGCMFISDEPLGVDSFLDLLISVRGRVVRTKGRVVYEIHRGAEEVEVGVEFVQIAPHDRDIIQELFSTS